MKIKNETFFLATYHHLNCPQQLQVCKELCKEAPSIYKLPLKIVHPLPVNYSKKH
jgi:hypothetical protein